MHVLDSDVTASPAAPERPLRKPDVLRLVPFSASTLERMVAKGTFPQPFRISARLIAWKPEDVREWLRARQEGE